MWYEGPTERLLTWNYAVLHVSGTIRRSSPTELNTRLDELAEMGEAMSPGLSWSPAHYNQARRALRVRRSSGSCSMSSGSMPSSSSISTTRRGIGGGSSRVSLHAVTTSLAQWLPLYRKRSIRDIAVAEGDDGRLSGELPLFERASRHCRFVTAAISSASSRKARVAMAQ